MGRVGKLILLLCAVPLLGGCTSILARKGDPNLDVLQHGATRAFVEKEMGHPKEVVQLDDGRYMAVYTIKLGAPVDMEGRGKSLDSIGAGASAAVVSGSFSTMINSALASGWSSTTRSNGAAALAVGLTVWGISEFTGTIRELNRLSKARKHRLEVVYDDRNRLVMHEIVPLSSGGGSSNNARKLANELDAPNLVRR